MTDGILLAELQRDRQLRKYDTIIIDEAHERSLNIDFLLGYLKRLLPRRPDLKLIITSATIDVERFAEHFDAPDRRGLRPHLPGRGPLPPADGRRRARTTRARSSSATRPRRSSRRSRSSSAEGPGDMLVFLPGEREIRDTADALTGDLPRHRDPAALLAAFGRRAAPRLRVARQRRTPRRARHQRRRDLADRPRHPVRRRHRRRADQPLLGAHQGAAAADRADHPGLAPTSAPGRCGRVAAGIASGSTPRRTSTAGPSSPTRRSCAPTWPASSCR